MWRMSDCEATTLLGLLRVRMVETCLRHSFVRSDIDFLPIVTWLERTFRSRLSFLPKTWVLANSSLPLNLSPSALGNVPAERMLSMSWTNSSTLSVVLDTRHNESPDCLRSSCTPSTLQIEEKGSNLCVETFQPRIEKTELTQKSTCLDSLFLDKQRKWSRSDSSTKTADSSTKASTTKVRQLKTADSSTKVRQPKKRIRQPRVRQPKGWIRQPKNGGFVNQGSSTKVPQPKQRIRQPRVSQSKGWIRQPKTADSSTKVRQPRFLNIFSMFGGRKVVREMR